MSPFLRMGRRFCRRRATRRCGSVTRSAASDVWGWMDMTAWSTRHPSPLTASTFDLIALLVFGMPYSAWRHDGVIWLLHDDGTDASDVIFEGAVGGVEKDGDPVAMPNLHTQSGSGSVVETRNRQRTRSSDGQVRGALGGRRGLSTRACARGALLSCCARIPRSLRPASR